MVAGQVLVEIERELLEAQAQEAAAELDAAKVERHYADLDLERARELEKSGAVSGIAPAGGRTAEDLMTKGAEGIDVLFATEAAFSERAKSPDVVANLRKAKFLVVLAGEHHPLAEVADFVLPTTIFAEKSGTFTNVQGRLQKIVAGSLPKCEALPEWEIFRRIGLALAPEEQSFAFSEVEELFDQMVSKTPALRSLDWSGIEQFGVTGAPQGS